MVYVSPLKVFGVDAERGLRVLPAGVCEEVGQQDRRVSEATIGMCSDDISARDHD